MGSKVVIGIRILLGVAFIVTGLNRFLMFAPMPPMPERAAMFLGGLSAVPYFWPMEAIVGIVAGVFLLIGRWVPLGLALLAPLLVNILALHIFEAQESIAPAAVLSVFWAVVAWSNRGAFAPLFTAKYEAAN